MMMMTMTMIVGDDGCDYGDYDDYCDDGCDGPARAHGNRAGLGEDLRTEWRGGYEVIMELGEGDKFSSIVRLPPPRDHRGSLRPGSRLLLQASHVLGFARI